MGAEQIPHYASQAFDAETTTKLNVTTAAAGGLFMSCMAVRCGLSNDGEGSVRHLPSVTCDHAFCPEDQRVEILLAR